MKAGLKDAYVDAVEQFHDKNSKKKMTGSFRLDGKYNDTMIIYDSSKDDIRGYRLGKKNSRSMAKLNQEFIDKFVTYFRLTLLGEGEKRLGEIIYAKSTCNIENSKNLLASPRRNDLGGIYRRSQTRPRRGVGF
jgi:hypothetical protein